MPDFLQTVLIFAIPVVLAITLHEAAHGYAAKALGDPTAYLLGRVSLNPLRHVDLIGTIAMPIGILLLTQGQFLFGWAKPVPVQFGRLRNPARHDSCGLCWSRHEFPSGLLLGASYAWANKF